jgi:DNA mismatch repair protein MutL
MDRLENAAVETGMARTIHVLPEHIANKIAAGEVVQRPESVVKELMENSLDAGAQKITVVIEEGGKKLIQVIDDGNGMSEEDACAAFGRHATSKIAAYEDLEAIRTFGFRGEALASIAAVAQVTMKTSRAVDEAAAVVSIDGGASPRVTHEGRPPGTSLAVRNLFFNVPARLKFLKTTTTEFRHVHEAVQRVALSHPGLGMEFISDGDTIFNLSPGSEEERMTDLFGARVVEGLIPVRETTEFISLSGYIGKPAFGQRSRAHQFLFLNRRPISNRNITHAVFSAYEHLLTKGTYPFFVLFLETDPAQVDVNVHPSKMEVKFENEQNVYRFVSTVVKKFLSGVDAVPSLTTGHRGGEIAFRFTSRQHSWPADDRTLGVGQGVRVDPATGEIVDEGQHPLHFEHPPPRDLAGSGDRLAHELLQDVDLPVTRAHQPVHPEPSSLIWQVHNKYILSQIKGGLMVVDQHVAHERVLYERALARFESAMSSAQQLLFPHTMELSAADHALVIELLPHLEQIGFGLKSFGGTTMVIEAVPPDVKVGAERAVLEEILATYREYRTESPLEVRDNVAKSFACRAAIKAGDSLSQQEMRSLIDQLFATRMPYVCPHGRPVVLKISIEELDRRFGRT